MKLDRVRQIIDLLFQYIEVVPADDFYPAIERADAAIGDTDPDDVLYLACAIAYDGAIWSDDSDFDEQNLVETYSTSDVIESFDTLSSANLSLRAQRRGAVRESSADSTPTSSVFFAARRSRRRCRTLSRSNH